MQVQEIMTHEVCCGSPETNAAAAAEIMWNRNCGSLPVVDHEGRVVGMVTDRDLFIALGTRNRTPAELALSEAMRLSPVLCAPADDVRDALKTMAREKIHRLPVVDDLGVLRGILSIDDVLIQPDSGLRGEAIRTLKAISTNQTATARAAEHLVIEAEA